MGSHDGFHAASASGAISGDKVCRLQGLVAQFDIDPANALTKQQALDPIDVGGSLAHQSETRSGLRLELWKYACELLQGLDIDLRSVEFVLLNSGEARVDCRLQLS